MRHLVLLCTLLATHAWAQTVQVDQVWVRPTHSGQQATGAFMTLTAEQASTLLSASSPLASRTEIHEMRMDGDVMTMRALPQGVPLPAHTAVTLRPGHIHVMLLGLKQAITPEQKVPLTLRFKDTKGKRWQIQVDATAHMQAPAAKSP